MTIASEQGYRHGLRDKGKFLPEPYPPYKLFTQKANEWIHSYRMARFGEDWQQDNGEAVEMLLNRLPCPFKIFVIASVSTDLDKQGRYAFVRVAELHQEVGSVIEDWGNAFMSLDETLNMDSQKLRQELDDNPNST